MPEGNTQIVSISRTHAGELIVITRQPSNERYSNGTPVPDKVWKTVYVARDGMIVLDKVIEGVHTPAHIVPEVIAFPPSASTAE